MRHHLEFPSFLQCESMLEHIEVLNIWWSSGGTKSVIHKDGAENLNCLIQGTKRVIFWSPAYSLAIEESGKAGWKDLDDNADTLKEGYGSFADLDVDDIERFPAYQTMEWHNAHMEAGDCLYIPVSWYHHVDSTGSRNIAANFWWFPRSEKIPAIGKCGYIDKPLKATHCLTDNDMEVFEEVSYQNKRRFGKLFERLGGSMCTAEEDVQSMMTEFLRFIAKHQQKMARTSDFSQVSHRLVLHEKAQPDEL